MTIFRELAHQEDGRLTSQDSHLVDLDAWFFYRLEMGGRGAGGRWGVWGGNKVKRPFSLASLS